MVNSANYCCANGTVGILRHTLTISTTLSDYVVRLQCSKRKKFITFSHREYLILRLVKKLLHNQQALYIKTASKHSG